MKANILYRSMMLFVFAIAFSSVLMAQGLNVKFGNPTEEELA